MPYKKARKRGGIHLKEKRPIIHGTSGDAIVRGKRGITKFFINDNKVYPRQLGRKPGKPITNHKAVEYYCLYFKERPPKTREDRIYGAGAPKTYSVRPIKLIREGKNYHIVEHINGPGLLDLLAVAEGIGIPKKGRGGRVESPEEAADYERRRKLMSEFIKKHKKEFNEFKKSVREMKNELNNHIRWIENSSGQYGDLYRSNLKENDFVVEGITKEGKLKLVMVDFQ